MGFDFSFVAYSGRPYAEEDIAKIIAMSIPELPYYRHAINGADIGVNAIAGYHDEFMSQWIAEQKVELPTFDRNKDDIVDLIKRTFKVAAGALRTSTPPYPPPTMERLAKLMSAAIDGRVAYVAQAENSGVGAFSLFDKGVAVPEHQATVKGEDFVDATDALWRSDFRTSISAYDFFNRAFDDRDGPRLRNPKNPSVSAKFVRAAVYLALD